jgi:hypothetical protein
MHTAQVLLFQIEYSHLQYDNLDLYRLPKRVQLQHDKCFHSTPTFYPLLNPFSQERTHSNVLIHSRPYPSTVASFRPSAANQI